MSEAGPSRSIPFKSKKHLLMDSPSSKSQTVNPNPSNVALPTPEKPAENILTRSRNRSVALSKRVSTTKNAEKDKLPEKYEILGKFFDALCSSIILSNLQGSRPTFYICGITCKRFCYSHLGQLKHILPEAMEINPVLIRDERTCCMEPDLDITFKPGAVEYNDKSKSESKNIALRKVFRVRLAEFVKAHPQGDEVPEDPLPELYMCSRWKPAVEVKSVSPVMEGLTFIPAGKLFQMASIPSLNKSTSTPIKTSSSPPTPTSSGNVIVTTPIKTSSSPILSDVNIVATPVKPLSTPVIVTPATPPECASSPARLLSTSLMARQQKRSSDFVSTDPPAKLVRRSLSLNFDSSPEDVKSMDVAERKTQKL